ncbi:MAG: DJ-1/PfpI family protein [Rubrivivax sp.]|nr:MAG: DJ-1/PfpI family protein [Rubrivivax sp.]
MTTIAILLYPQVTQLDLTGPYEVFCRCPDTQVHLVWKDRGPVITEHGLTMLPTTTFDELPAADVLCVPGAGQGVHALLQDQDTLAYVRQVARGARYVSSVCTGSLVLGAAGLLKDRKATTHWSSMHLLAEFGAIATPGRVVQDGRFITGGGVTAGIDFALTMVAALHGDAVAQAIQLGIEYNPAPPFNAGHPDVAPIELVELVKQRLSHRLNERLRLVRQAAQAITL